MSESVTVEAWNAVEIRVGVIVAAEPFPEARQPAFRLSHDLGAGRGVAHTPRPPRPPLVRGGLGGGVPNLPPRRIGPFVSEVLTLGLPDESGEAVLVRPDFDVPPGGRLY